MRVIVSVGLQLVSRKTKYNITILNSENITMGCPNPMQGDSNYNRLGHPMVIITISIFSDPT